MTPLTTYNKKKGGYQPPFKLTNQTYENNLKKNRVSMKELLCRTIRLLPTCQG